MTLLRVAANCAMCIALFALVLGSNVAHAEPVQAVASDRAADMVGVNTHINYTDTIYYRSFDSIIKPRLIELGVRHIRDNPGSSSNTTIKQRYVDLAKSGIRTLLINWRLSDHSYVKSVNALGGMQVVEAVEPPNERDNSGSTWKTVLRDFMKMMYPTYKADSTTSEIPVLGPSFANGRDSALALAKVFPNAVDFMDRGNVHDYSGVYPEGPQGGGWGISVNSALQRYSSLSGPKRIWATENGYKMSGSVTGHPAVTQRAAAKYLPRNFLFHLKLGVERYYIYQLINNSENFGILNTNGTPRLQFTSVKNFIAMFADPGASFQPGSLDYAISGDMTSIYSALFQKQNGRFYLVLWQGVPSSGGTTDGTIRDIEPPVRNLTLTLATEITQANVYHPSFSMQPAGSYSDAEGIATLALQVPDHILVIELIP